MHMAWLALGGMLCMKKYYAAESDQEDLISIGTIGLISYPPGQFLPACCGFGVMYDQIDRCHAPYNGHLPGHLAGMPDAYDVDTCNPLMYWIRNMIFWHHAVGLGVKGIV